MSVISRLKKRLFHVPDTGEYEIAQGATDESARLVEYIHEEFERRQEERRPFELQWRLNQNFVAGNQWSDVDGVMGDLEEVAPVYDWMQAETYNHLAPIVATRLAKLGRVQPGLSVRPATSDNADQAAAKLSTQLLKGFCAAVDMNRLVREASMWMETCGTAFIKSTWNREAGRVIGNVNGKVVREGDLQVTVVPAYEIYPDSVTRTDIDRCQSVIHAKAYTVDEIYRLWGVRVEGRTVDVFSMDNSGVVEGGAGYNPGYSTIQRGKMDEAEIVLEWMERPSPEQPEGRLAIVAGDVLLHLGPLPWRVGEYGERGIPLARMICESNPGYLFGVSVVERCIPIQRAYNAVQNRIHEFIARATIGVLVAEEGTVVNEEVLDDGIPPGSVLEVQRGATFPQWMQSPPIPQALLEERESLENQFILISGTSEIARNSQLPSSAISGVAIELLKEQDDTRISQTAENIRDAVRRCGVIWIRLLRQFVTTARLTRVAGEDMDVRVDMWRGSDLTSDDVVIDTDNELSNTPAQRKNTALELYKAGLFTDPATGQLTRSGRLALMDAFNLGNWEDVADLDELQRQQAQRENEIAADGGEITVIELDDTEIHLLEHTKYVYSAAYRELRQTQPDRADVIMEHIAYHRQMQQQAAAGQMAAQNAAIEDAARQKLELEAMTAETTM